MRKENLILIMVSIAAMKHWEQKQLGRKVFVSLSRPYNSSSSEAVRAGTWTGQECGSRNVEAVEKWCLASSSWEAFSTRLLKAPRTSSLGVAPPTMGWSLPHPLLRKCPITCLLSILWSQFLIWGSLNSDNYSFCQADMKFAGTWSKPISKGLCLTVDH